MNARSKADLILPGYPAYNNAWILPSGEIYRFFYGQHGSVAARHLPNLLFKTEVEFSDEAERQGWMMIRWPGAQDYPDIIAVVCRYEPIPGPQMDMFLEWCDRWGCKPSELEVCVTASPMSISEWLFRSKG